MRCGSAELVTDETVDPSLSERDRIPLTLHSSHYVSLLPPRGVEPDSLHVVVRVDGIFIREATDKALWGVLQGRSSSNDDAERNSTVGMQSLEILKVAVEKRVLIIPFD